jgi:hypothetical protein
LAHKFAGILRFHAAAVLNPHFVGCEGTSFPPSILIVA